MKKRNSLIYVLSFMLAVMMLMCTACQSTPSENPSSAPTAEPTEEPTPEPTEVPVKPMAEILTEIQTMEFTSSKNVILIIADGCGQNHVPATDAITGGRYDGKLALEYMPVSFIVDTKCVDGEPDSASGGTAYATGYKSNRGVIGMTTKKEKVENVVELAHRLGKSTAVITTENICDATPATFTVHNKDRSDETTLAGLQITDCVADIILGGGTETYERLMTRKPEYADKLAENNVTWVKTWDEVQSFSGNGRLIATMTEDYWFESEKTTPSLPEMTQYCLDKLSQNENGFFMMIEAGALDEVAHQGDLIELTKHMIDCDKAVEIALRYAYDHKDTVVIVTADHNTGRLLPKDEADAWIEKNQKSDQYIADEKWCMTNAKLHCVLECEKIAQEKHPETDIASLPYRFTTIAHTSDSIRTWAVGYNTSKLLELEKAKSFQIGKFIGEALSGEAFGAENSSGTK